MAELSEGVTVEELSGPIYEKFSKSFAAFKEGFIKLQPYNQVVPRCFLKYEKRIKTFDTRPDDIWVASFPKCGKFPCFKKHFILRLSKCFFLSTRTPTYYQ